MEDVILPLLIKVSEFYLRKHRTDFERSMTDVIPFSFLTLWLALLNSAVLVGINFVLCQLSSNYMINTIIITIINVLYFSYMARGQEREQIVYLGMSKVEKNEVHTLSLDRKKLSKALNAHVVITAVIISNITIVTTYLSNSVIRITLFSIIFIISWHFTFKGLLGYKRYRFYKTALTTMRELAKSDDSK